MAKNILGEWVFDGGYVSSVPRSLLRNVLAWGSLNAILTGLGFIRNYAGSAQISHALEKGSWQFFQTDNNYAGLGDQNAYGKGNVFKVQRVLAFTGIGALRFGGADISVSANSTLQYVKKVAGNYVSPAYQAGHARPSSQTIFPKSPPGAGHVGMDGSVSTCIWRIDSTTGQVSIASLASNVLILSGQTVIQPFPAVDANAQDFWGIGVSKPGFGTAPVFYQLKTDLGGEVAESTLAYTRTIAQGSITSADKTLTLNTATPIDNRFTAADVGRRVSITGKLDSWIASVTDAFNAETNDNATATATNESTLVRHAVNGILRAVEIHWTSESLAGQELAPFDAYPPPSNLAWAGILNDTMFVEDTDGIIFVGVPGFIGSFPPKNVLFPTEPATLYLDGSDGLFWRFSKNTLCVLTYVGGFKPLELQQIWKNVGVLFPQNAAIGMGGRVIGWAGKPVRLGAGRDPEVAFALRVYKDFEGWNAQTQTKPVVVGFDGENQFECWAFGQRIMAYHPPSDNWCSPIDLSGYLTAGEWIISMVSVNNKLRFATNKGTSLQIYKFDEGTGSMMTVRTPDADSQLKADTISEIQTKIHVDNTQSVVIKIIKNGDDANAVTVDTIVPAATPAEQIHAKRPNIINAKSHAVQIQITSIGKNCGVQKVSTWGESSDIFIG